MLIMWKNHVEWFRLAQRHEGNLKSNQTFKTMQKMKTTASAFRKKLKFGLPEYSWHSLYKTKHVPQVKISRVPITNERMNETRNDKN